ncbi:MAG: exodeoxyribonuclease VII small subunit [Clostridiales Family XIII bacterium]|jgi:exodeoxyribonuclease VII small subunit|nr:exodeoxyribonuclease VII small subunit [Clostridiales Family XIII bacterium]
MTEDELSFEEALAKLESCADRIASKDVTLEEAIKAYEEGASYYEQCDLILRNARQRVRKIGTDPPDGEEG